MEQKTSGFELSLADGSGWVINSEDDRAASFVSHFSKVMRLQEGVFSGRPLFVGFDERPFSDLPIAEAQIRSTKTPLKFYVPRISSGDMFALQARRMSLLIACAALHRGGVLLHGALAEYCPSAGSATQATAQGVVMVGPSGIGKTTASLRLPSPWRSLSDDLTLVVRDAAGVYWAHAWPTWSRFIEKNGVTGGGGSWDVQHFSELKAFFFLSQSSIDEIEQTFVTQTMGMLMDSVRQESCLMELCQPKRVARLLHYEQLAAIKSMAAVIPGYLLRTSLAGSFWESMESALERRQEVGLELGNRYRAPECSLDSCDARGTKSIDGLRQGSGKFFESQIVYSGCSMYPTLREPELVDVKPYSHLKPRVGDVVFCRRSSGQYGFVHRIVRINKEGILTRADNNEHIDSEFLQLEEIVGKVVSARGSSSIRSVAGGTKGRLVGFFVQKLSRKPTWLFFWSGGKPFSGLYRLLVRSRFPFDVLFQKLGARVVVFKTRSEDHLKLIVGMRELGRYHRRDGKWEIRPAFRLFVDDAGLPRK